MANPIGGVWAQKSGESQPTSFASTGTGIQAALDYCGGAIGSFVWVGPGDYTVSAGLTMHGKTSLFGYGALVTRLNYAAGFAGTALREKTAGEGNVSGATGITVAQIGFYGVSTMAGGIDFGSQGGASFNANAQLWDILVRDITAGFGIKLVANAIHCRNIWAANCAKGIWLLNGGANHYDGLWAEQCSVSNLIVDGSPWNTFVHVQIEQSGGAPSGPLIDLATANSDRNVFCGVYMTLQNNLTNLIIARTGVIGSQFYGIRVVPNGFTYTNTIYTEGTATGTGAVDWIGFFNDMSSSGKHFFNDQTLAEVSTFTGARPTFPQATIGSLNVTGTSGLIGALTAGVAGTGYSAELGQGTTGTDSSTVRARSGSNAAAIAQFILRQNTTDQAGFRFVAGDTYVDYGGTLRFRSGFSGTERANMTAGGNVIFNGSVAVGAGAPMVKVLTGTAALNYDLTALTTQDLTITVTGAAIGDCVLLGVDNASVTATIQYTAWVSGANTVTVRARTLAAGENPASGTFRATVIQH